MLGQIREATVVPSLKVRSVKGHEGFWGFFHLCLGICFFLHANSCLVFFPGKHLYCITSFCLLEGLHLTWSIALEASYF